MNRVIIELRDSTDSLFFADHWGSVKSTKPVLDHFMDRVKKKDIRDNVTQAAGWLVLMTEVKDGWKACRFEPCPPSFEECQVKFIVDLKEKTVAYRASVFEALTD